jgi:hypothetical protein
MISKLISLETQKLKQYKRKKKIPNMPHNFLTSFLPYLRKYLQEGKC